MHKNILVIGIAGGSGSGKSTLVKNLIAEFPDMVTVLSHDNYYRRHDELTYEQRTHLNYDEPGSLETDLMARHLEIRRQGGCIDCPVYDFTIHNRLDATIPVVPEKVIIVEGILIFENRQLRDLMDIGSLWMRMQTCGCAAGSFGTYSSGGALWRACWSSTSRPSSPCTSSMWSPARNLRISSFPAAARIWWRWKCLLAGLGGIWRENEAGKFDF